jgi:hypothetical protein
LLLQVVVVVALRLVEVAAQAVCLLPLGILLLLDLQLPSQWVVEEPPVLGVVGLGRKGVVRYLAQLQLLEAAAAQVTAVAFPAALAEDRLIVILELVLE